MLLKWFWHEMLSSFEAIHSNYEPVLFKKQENQPFPFN